MPVQVVIEVEEPPEVPGYTLKDVEVGFTRRYTRSRDGLQAAVEKWVSLGTAAAHLYAIYASAGKPEHVREWTGSAWASRRTRA